MAVSSQDVHLAEWLFALTDQEFRAVSAAHLALGHLSRDLEGGIVTVETVSGTLVVTHFREEIAQADHIRVSSPDTRAYAFPGCSRRVGLVWDLSVRPAGPGLSALHSSLQLRGYGRPALTKGGRRPFGRGTGSRGSLGIRPGSLRPLTRGIHAHLLHETRGFAADIEAKFGRARPSDSRSAAIHHGDWHRA
jgi:hypothetical protein